MASFSLDLLIYKQFFHRLPDISVIVDTTSGAYYINDVNESFEKAIMPKAQGSKLSFTHDFLNFDERGKFMATIEIMKMSNKSSTLISKVATLTLLGDMKCESFYQP